MTGLIDKYLAEFGTTRYKVAKISGLTENALRNANNQQIKDMSVRVLQALSMATAQTDWYVLRRLHELSSEDLKGFRALIDKYNVQDEKQEIKLRTLIFELETRGVTINEFTFNRFEDEEHDNIKTDISIAMGNAIQLLQKALENVKEGNAPTPE